MYVTFTLEQGLPAKGKQPVVYRFFSGIGGAELMHSFGPLID